MTWCTKLAAGSGGEITPAIFFEGRGKSANNRIEGVSFYHSPIYQDYYIDIRIDLDELSLRTDFEITGIEVTVDWGRQTDGGADTVLEVKHNNRLLFPGLKPPGNVLGRQTATRYAENLNLTSGLLTIQGHLDSSDPSEELLKGHLYFTRIILTGEGVNPFIAYGWPQCEHDGSSCGLGVVCPDDVGRYPIRLRDGEKREVVTDVSLNTPAGPLAFTRTFRQNKLNEVTHQFMGAGWTHNHHVYLDLANTPDEITLHLPDGGDAKFIYDQGEYKAVSGGTSHITEDDLSTEERYTLYNSDQTSYVFDDQGKLRGHHWPNGNSWLYHYYGDVVGEENHIALNHLKNTTDGHGRELAFVYAEFFNQVQLWRVGVDLQNLDTVTPSQPHIEFLYEQERLGGALTGQDILLLTHIKDVNFSEVGTLDDTNSWKYLYYGKETHETDVTLKNFLTEVISPLIDIEGGFEPDTSLTLKRLNYVPEIESIAELAINGDMELDSTWVNIPNSPALINEQSTTQVETGNYSRHIIADADTGIQGNIFELVIGRIYNITARVYIVSGSLSMRVYDEAGLIQTNSETANWETLTITYNCRSNKKDQVLQFISDQAGSEFYIDYVSIEEVIPSHLESLTQERGIYNDDEPLITTSYAFQPDGRNITLETTAGGTITHYFANGVYAGPANQLGLQETKGLDSNYRANAQQDANGNVTRLEWSEDGQTLNKVKNALGETTEFEYDNDNRLIRSIDAQGHITEYVYSSLDAPRSPTEIRVLDEDALTLLRLQRFTYDTQGRSIQEQTVDPTDEVTILQQTTRTYSSSGEGNGLLESVTQVDIENAGNNQSTTYTYDWAGRITKTQHSSLFGQCQTSYTVYDLAGNVIASICNYDPGANPDPTTAEEAANLYDPAEPDKNNVTTHEYDALNRRIATTTHAGAPFEQTTLTLFDALDRPWRTINYYHNPKINENPDEYLYTAPGIWQWNEINLRWEDGEGETISHGADGYANQIQDTAYNARGLTRKTRNALGQVTLYGYDTADRQIKTIQNALDTNYDNDYGSGDPGLANYLPDIITPDADIISEYGFDANGNLIKTIDPLGNVTFTVYDELNRPIQILNSASDTDYALDEYNDLREYTFSTLADQDLLTSTQYDSLGRVLETGQLISRTANEEHWVYQRNVYDSLGRQRLTIRNYIPQDEDPELWHWNEAGSHWVQSDNTPINHGVLNDQNIISEQVYDEAGRVRFSRDMQGTKHWQVYDGLGRSIKQITACTYVEGSPSPEDPLYIGNLSAPDADIITETYFDSDGRVNRQRQLVSYDAVSGEGIWSWTLTGYDSLGRTVRTIQNASDPNYAIAQDPTLENYVPVVASDYDLISDTAYDNQGRVYKTVNPTGEVTLQGFDTIGRVIKTVQNASDPDYDVVDDPRLSAYPVSSDTDQDNMTQQFYDLAGRVYKRIEVSGQTTFIGYDRLGRQVKQIQNASDADYDVLSDPTLSGYVVGTAADMDRITETHYDKSGRSIRRITPQQNISLTGYDLAGRVIKTIQNASNPDYDIVNDPDLSNYQGNSPAEDQDQVTTTSYNKAGYILTEQAVDGDLTLYRYDELGRRVRTIQHYQAQGNSNPAGWYWDAQEQAWLDEDNVPVNHGTDLDRNIITDSLYGTQGSIILRRDALGIEMAFRYDRLGRQIVTTEAANTQQQTQHYTCYNKAGWTERIIRNWQDGGIAPEAKDAAGNWMFAPTTHGTANDQNLITEYAYDALGRQTVQTDADGQTQQTAYHHSGQVEAQTNENGVQTYFCYDRAQRRTRVIQSYTPQAENPSEWVWNASTERYETSTGTPIDHGANDDENIIVTVEYDKLGQRLNLRDPRGNLTAYDYDALGRRTRLTNALNEDWLTAYEDLLTGGTRTTLTHPGLESGTPYQVQQDFDRLGRMIELDYGDADTTPRVEFDYHSSGQRAQMHEYDTNGLVRQTVYHYDAARRLTEVAFDINGDTLPEQTVRYAYDLSGRRTQLQVSENQSIHYRYGAKGQLLSLTDWDQQTSHFEYDGVGRQRQTVRQNGLRTSYRHTPAGHLERIAHQIGNKIIGQFRYQLDAAGNRTSANERLAEPSVILATYDKDYAGITYTGLWDDVDEAKQSQQFSARLSLMFTGQEAQLTMTTGPDHSIFDVYIGGSLWQSFDGYAESPGEQTIMIYLQQQGTFPLEIRNRAARNLRSSGYVIGFRQMQIIETAYIQRQIGYVYDKVSRLIEADYGDAQYTYAYDLAGNLTNMNGVTRAYNAANQMVHDGTNALTYDNNGNMISDGVNNYAWDRANRLVSMGGHIYAYNGDGNRVRQTVDSLVTDYLLDLQPALALVLGDSAGNRYVHAPRGIHAVNEGAGWHSPLTDALGSVRSLVSASQNVASVRSYDPYGNPESHYGAGFGFTGEQTDENGQLYLRARYYNPALGVFPSLDPFEGLFDRPMSLNGYAWVEGNVVNRVDPSGLCTDCQSAFRVNTMEAGRPSERIALMENFNDTRWNLPLDVWDVLGREMDFVRWMEKSGRLTNPKAGNWYDVADSYLVASRFAGARLIEYLKGNYQCGTPYTGPLDPGVVEWATFVFAAEQTRSNAISLYLQLTHFLAINNLSLVSGSTVMNIGFWRAHNAALREGVRRADAAGLRAIEPAEERMLINYILYNVLEPGDHCGNGNMAFCGFTLPFQLYIGAFHIYPQDYPATQQDLDLVSFVFRPIYGAWSLLDVRLPDPEIHLIK